MQCLNYSSIILSAVREDVRAARRCGEESWCLTEAASGTGPALTGNVGRQPKDTFSFT